MSKYRKLDDITKSIDELLDSLTDNDMGDKDFLSNLQGMINYVGQAVGVKSNEFLMRRFKDTLAKSEQAGKDKIKNVAGVK